MPLAVCATPIGNLDDVTIRVLAELGSAETILCEDTRRTGVLLRRHGLEGPRLLSYHEHNEDRRVREALPWLEAGRRIALVTDAGLPGISDPGARLIGAALDAGLPVTVLPGPSAVETALVASGHGGGRYRFVGFVPRAEGDRGKLWKELAGTSDPTVAFESPQRLARTLASLAAIEPDRSVAVCRELTKLYEEVARGTAAELAERFSEAPKGEVTLVIGPTPDRDDVPGRADEAVRAVADLVAGGTPRRLAADVVARITGVPKNTLYRASL